MTLDVAMAHENAWYAGQEHFGYDGLLPKPHGMLIGEAPGPHTDAQMPLFPKPSNSSAARLIKYADIDPAAYMGKLVRMNLCDDFWSERRAVAGVIRALSYLLDPVNFRDGTPLRVLLLGRRVADAWNCVDRPFGYEPRPFRGDSKAEYINATVLQLAWIPHPSGRCLLYNDRRNQLRAGRALRWAAGERRTP